MEIITSFLSTVRTRSNGRTNIEVPRAFRNSIAKDIPVEVILIAPRDKTTLQPIDESDFLETIIIDDTNFKSRESEVVSILKENGPTELLEIAYRLQLTLDSAKKLINRIICLRGTIKSTNTKSGRFIYEFRS